MTLSEPRDDVVVLGNSVVERVLEMSDVVPALERAYEDLGNGNAINAPRVDTIIPLPTVGQYYGLKTMVGSLPRIGLTALRINSDIVSWVEREGKRRRFKHPVTSDGRYLQHLFLFSNGALVARMPDGYIQSMRVGGTSGLATDYLARTDANTVGLIGSGWQARGQLLALDAVPNLERVDVYSPTEGHREAFANDFDDRLDATVAAVDSPEEAVADKEIIDVVTNSIDPVLDPDWLRPGVHVNVVKREEVTRESIRKADLTVLNSVDQITHQSVELEPVPGSQDGWWNDDSTEFWEPIPSLQDVVADPPERADEDVTLFVNNIGLGIQFAAVGGIVLKEARERGLGEREPLDTYTQDENYMGNRSA